MVCARHYVKWPIDELFPGLLQCLTHTTVIISSPSLSLFPGYNPQHKHQTSHGAKHLTPHLNIRSSSCWVQHKHHSSVNSDQAKMLLTWGFLLPNSCGFCYVDYFHTEFLQSWFYGTDFNGNKKIKTVHLLTLFISPKWQIPCFLFCIVAS